MKVRIFIAVCCLLAVVGCQTNGREWRRGEHEIPVARDYKSLEKVKIRDAQEVVDKAHRVGAHHFATYEYLSAAGYVDMAREERAEGDTKGTRDYAGLAKKIGQEAIDKGSGIADGGVKPLPRHREEVQAEFDRLKARFKELHRCKAILVAPDIYAHVETALSYAEHELKERSHYPEAWMFMSTVDADIDAILAKDMDKDGITDIEDGDPWIPEDKDGYEDGDGIPEPKPYPALDSVLFKDDSADLCAYSKGYVQGVAKMFLWNYNKATLSVVGYTDSRASEEYNMGLSKRRAEAVKQALVKGGVAADRLAVSHHGEASPVADNATAEGRAKNRRVELKLDSPDVDSPYCYPKRK